MVTRPRILPARSRDAAATRERIIEAVGTLLAREGFGALGVNALAREAGVDKVLIYRYFGGLDELLRAFGQSRSFWPSFEELAPDPASILALSPGDRVATVMRSYLHALRIRPLTLEILAWETVARSPLTAQLEHVREALALRLMATLAPSPSGSDAPFEARQAALLALLGGALNYLLVRSRTTTRFNGADLTSEAGWRDLEEALAHICRSAFVAPWG